MEIEGAIDVKVPFKNPEWIRKKKEHKAAKNLKQNKTLKQICTNEMTNNKRINCNVSKAFINLKFLIDLHLDAPSSLKPPKKYCDITGFEVIFFFF